MIEEPRPGLFGRMRGEARLRARVRPAQVRPKQERRRKGKSDRSVAGATTDTTTDTRTDATTDTRTDAAPPRARHTAPAKSPKESTSQRRSSTNGSAAQPSEKNEEQPMSNEDRPASNVTPEEVDGLTAAFGVDGSSTLHADGLELHVDVSGSELGLLVGPGGRTLNAIQDLARVSAQRRLGDHETRLRVDVAGYRERREAALAAFARDVAEQVRTSGTARSLEAMSSSDRKVVHDVLNDEAGVTSRSVGEDPDRRIIVEPA